MQVKFITKTIEEMNPYGFETIELLKFKGNKIIIEEELYKIINKKYPELKKKYILIIKDSLEDRMKERKKIILPLLFYTFLFIVFPYLKGFGLFMMIKFYIGFTTIFIILYELKTRRKEIHEDNYKKHSRIINSKERNMKINVYTDILKMLSKKGIKMESKAVRDIYEYIAKLKQEEIENYSQM